MSKPTIWNYHAHAQSPGKMAQPAEEGNKKSSPEFIEILQKEQAATEVTIQQLS